MKRINHTVLLATLVLAFGLLNSCKKEVFIPDELDSEGTLVDEDGNEIQRPDDWTTNTHSNYVDPDYNTVFDQNEVKRLDIVVSASEYNIMQEDLASLISTTGGGMGGPGTTTFSDENPVYVPADVYCNGLQWYEVGLRYKGNSSLYSAYQDGNGKLPLRLKFDKFEDEFPEIYNQRFYGFKDLSMSSNFKDESFMREKAATDIFREFGVPAARSAYYEVYMDAGDGPVYMGLYTMVEVVFDTMLEDVFGSDDGNCYKPDGDGAAFSTTGFSLADFEKKTNEDEADWSDIQELYDALHASTRTSDVETWKTNLESVFDVDGFLRYLAANNTIQNWDTYGQMTHNYYLYHDPADDLIKWIAWDNNEAFTDGGPRDPLSLEMSEVGTDWPMISYIVNVDEYRAIYDGYLQDFIDGPFLPSKMETQYFGYDMLIANSATSEISGYTFLTNSGDYSNAVSEIISHCSDRTNAVNAYLQ